MPLGAPGVLSSPLLESDDFGILYLLLRKCRTINSHAHENNQTRFCPAGTIEITAVRASAGYSRGVC